MLLLEVDEIENATSVDTANWNDIIDASKFSMCSNFKLDLEL
jgi:hypothetical protein